MVNNKKVLVIEDDVHVCRVYDARFTKEGILTSFAYDGEEGMKKILAEKPDLVILDLMLPNKDGFAVLDEMKKNPDLVSIPVLIISNLGSSADIERAIALGAKEHMVKVSHSIQEVVDKVKKYLGTN